MVLYGRPDLFLAETTNSCLSTFNKIAHPDGKPLLWGYFTKAGTRKAANSWEHCLPGLQKLLSRAVHRVIDHEVTVSREPLIWESISAF